MRSNRARVSTCCFAKRRYNCSLSLREFSLLQHSTLSRTTFPERDSYIQTRDEDLLQRERARIFNILPLLNFFLPRLLSRYFHVFHSLWARKHWDRGNPPLQPCSHPLTSDSTMGCFSWLPTSRSTFDPTAGGSISYTIIKRKEKFNTLQNASKIFLCASKKKQKQTYPESQVAQGRQGVRDTQIMRHEPPPRAIAPKSFNVAKLGRHPRIPVKTGREHRSQRD